VVIEDVIDIAYNAAALPTPKNRKPNRNAALYRYWVEHREVGTRLTDEFPLEDGTAAIVCSTGKVLHWTGGDTVVER
jgi:hypothetical protein